MNGVVQSMVNVKPVKLGKNTRMSFGKINEVLEMPNLIEVQKNSYQWFLDEGLKEVFEDVSPITDYNGNLELEFIDYRLEDTPKYTVMECKERDATYSAALRVTTRLFNKETGEIKEQEIFMGDFPLMTEAGTFIINGAERVIVSQLVRSPGVYYDYTRDKTGKKLYTTTVIPNRGAWLEYETDSSDVFNVRIDKNRKIPVTVFIRALGLGSDEEILSFFGEDEKIIGLVCAFCVLLGAVAAYAAHHLIACTLTIGTRGDVYKRQVLQALSTRPRFRPLLKKRLSLRDSFPSAF